MNIKVCKFTVLELLVVISIIVMLASLLLPALNKAKDSGRQISCLSNLKQYALGFGMYQSSYNDYYPPWSYKNVDLSIWNWVWSLKDIGVIFPIVCKCPSSTGVLTHPSVNGADDCVNRPEYPYAYYTTAYGYNYLGLGSSYYTTWNAYSAPAKTSQVRRPSTTLAVSDGWNKVNRAFCLTTYAGDIVIHDRHHNGANILFADGHVNWLRQAYYTYNDSTGFKRE